MLKNVLWYSKKDTCGASLLSISVAFPITVSGSNFAPGELLYLVECSYSRDDRTVARSVGEVAFVSVEVRAVPVFTVENFRT